MKIFSVYYRHKRGGFNRRLYRLYQGLADRGIHLHYLALEALPVRHANIFCHRLQMPLGRRENTLFWCLFLLWAPLACLWQIWRLRPERIVVFSSFYAFVCAPAAWVLKRPMVTFLRADVTAEAILQQKSMLRVRMLDRFQKIGLACSSRVVTASETMRRDVQRRSRGIRATVLPNDVTAPAAASGKEKAAVRGRYGLEDAEFVIVTAAPLSPLKNIDFLIRAFAQLDTVEGRLVVVGDDLYDGGERRRLEQLAAAITRPGRVVFTGWLESPFPVIAAADLFVFPSAREGSPNALLEALGCGVPCLGGRIPEIIEVLAYDELLFSITATAELREKLIRAAGDIEFRRRLAALSAERRDHFTFDWESAAVELVLATPSAPAQSRNHWF